MYLISINLSTRSLTIERDSLLVSVLQILGGSTILLLLSSALLLNPFGPDNEHRASPNVIV